MQATRVEIGNASIQFERRCNGVTCDNNSQRCVYIPWNKTMVCNFRHPTPESADSITMWLSRLMVTSSKGKKIRVTGPLRGESTGHRWIPLTKASDAEFWCFLWSSLNKRLSKQSKHMCLGCHRDHYDAIVMLNSMILQPMEAWIKRTPFCRLHFEKDFSERVFCILIPISSKPAPMKVQLKISQHRVRVLVG